MDSNIRASVAARAQYRCEYCHVNELDDAFTFHVEHVIAQKHGGYTELDNLAFACQHCNLHKGPNLSGIDPHSGKITSLFNPRQQLWSDHFELSGSRVTGSTATGRATIEVLAINDPDRIRLRALLSGHEP